MNIEEIRKERIAAFINSNEYKPLMIDELALVLDVPKTDMGKFKEIIALLEKEGRILKTKKKRYISAKKQGVIIGILTKTFSGNGFIKSDENKKDIFILRENMNDAMNNDTVAVKIISKRSHEKSDEGTVIKIIARANKNITGIIKKKGRYAYIYPDDKRIDNKIIVASRAYNGAPDGSKVAVSITRYPSKGRKAGGEVTEVLGIPGDIKTEMLSIVKTYNLNENFSDDVINETLNIKGLDIKKEIKNRKDLRKDCLITIDGKDAKDLDDAVSLKKLKNNNWLLGVHIADVSYYVKEGSFLDEEAKERGTSVYLADRVIPMLPKELSNGICSLGEREERLCFSVEMEIDKTGNVVSHDIFESIISTKYRMTYENVFQILTHDKKLDKKYNDIVPMLNDMRELSLILHKKRKLRGAVDLETTESKIMLDKNGMPCKIEKYNITFANKIIEEFMILCNETVAEHFYWIESPFVYRVHDEPDMEKIKTFSQFISKLGYNLRISEKIYPAMIQDVIEKAKGKAHEKVISTLMLRSLKKAEYSPFNIGHFGLASKYYCHFTSPIRRYPDLIIHRIIKENIKGEMDKNRIAHYTKILSGISKSCSLTERNSENAERDSVSLFKAVYMKKYIGDIFCGIVTGIQKTALYVELENTVEGMIHVKDMDGWFYYDDEKLALVEENGKRKYTIGSRVNVIVTNTNPVLRQVYFILKEDI